MKISKWHTLWGALCLCFLLNTFQPHCVDAATAPSERVHLNQASVEELASLPGIGPHLAQRIVEYRKQKPFQKVEDLVQVPGIGKNRLEELRALVRIQ